jgi:HD-GYP domain-containing protein (c-di-GMP phosphodiesterase class II)
MTRAQALEELRQCAGKQFDPQIVQVFVRLVDVEKET